MFKKALRSSDRWPSLASASRRPDPRPGEEEDRGPEAGQVRSEYRLRFVDENGDGINDLFRDHDGDGIPNCQDPDWAPPKDGSGYRRGRERGRRE